MKYDDYKVTHEKSKFTNGFRPKVINTKNDTVLFLGQGSFKTPEAAEKAAQAYLDGYDKGGDRAANRELSDFKKKNQNLVIKEHVGDLVESEKSSEEIVNSLTEQPSGDGSYALYDTNKGEFVTNFEFDSNSEAYERASYDRNVVVVNTDNRPIDSYGNPIGPPVE